MKGERYTLVLNEQEMCDLLYGLDRLKEHAVNGEEEQRFHTLRRKINKVFEDRN